MKKINNFNRGIKYYLSTIFFILLLLSCKAGLPENVFFRVPPDGTVGGPSGPDITPPHISVSDISFTSISQNSLTVNWGTAFDVIDGTNLQYKLVKDNTALSNINTIEKANAKTGGDLLLDWAANVTSHNVSGLTVMTTYHFVVLVKDTAENIALYTPTSQETASTGTLISPDFAPAAGIYASAQNVTITSASSGVTICYTTNGSTPTATTSGTCSNGTTLANGDSFSLSTEGTTTIKAIATKALATNSSVSNAVYTIDYPPANITSFVATAGLRNIFLSWVNPSDVDFGGVKIMRKTGSYPTHKDDGTLVYNETGTSFNDTSLVNGISYYYKAFAYDTVGHYAVGVEVTETPDNEDLVNWNKKFTGNGHDEYSNYSEDKANSIAIDSNGNVYVAGYGYKLVNASSGQDWWIKKFSSSGVEDTTNWNKKFDISGSADQAYSVAIDSNDNVYIVGYSYGSGSLWIKKFSSNGVEDTTNWNKQLFYNCNNDYCPIAIDSNDNVYVVSNSMNYSSLITKFSNNGAVIIQWNTFYNNFPPLDYSTPTTSIAIDSNDNVYVAGYGYNLVSGSSGTDWWIKKFDSDGNEDDYNWDKKFDGNDYCEATSIAIDSNNNVYVVGFASNLVSGSSGDDWWIKKFSSSGLEDGYDWDKKFDGTGGADQANSIAIDSNDNVYVAGYGYNLINVSSGDNWWIKKFDSSGLEDTISWNRKFDGGEGNPIARSIAIDSNDNVYVAGFGYDLVNVSGDDGGGSYYDWWIKKFVP